MKKISQIVLGLLLTVTLIIPELNAKHHGKKEEHRTEHSHKYWAGGSLTLWKNSDSKETTLSIRPEFGHLLKPNLGIGAMLNYTQEGSSRIYGLTPFARLYYVNREPFNLYLDAGVGLNWMQSKIGMDIWSKATMGYEVGIRPGACIDLTPGLCLCLRMGFIGYRDKFTTGEEHELSPSGFGVSFAPEHLMVGLELEF